MNLIVKDILTVEHGVIGHQVNLRQKMGAGLARHIRMRFPIAYLAYMNRSDRPRCLGDAQFVLIRTGGGKELWVANLAGQNEYGKTGSYTSHEALARALRKAVTFCNERNLTLWLPFKIGCGLGGGDWEKISAFIHFEAPEAIVCRQPQ